MCTATRHLRCIVPALIFLVVGAEVTGASIDTAAIQKRLGTEKLAIDKERRNIDIKIKVINGFDLDSILEGDRALRNWKSFMVAQEVKISILALQLALAEEINRHEVSGRNSSSDVVWQATFDFESLEGALVQADAGNVSTALSFLQDRGDNIKRDLASLRASNEGSELLQAAILPALGLIAVIILVVWLIRRRARSNSKTVG